MLNSEDVKLIKPMRNLFKKPPINEREIADELEKNLF